MNMKDKALELWNYLATTGEASKAAAYKELNFAPDLNDCPLCQIVMDKVGLPLDCRECLLYNKWHGRNNADHSVCTDDDTYFYHWLKAKTKSSRQVYAKAMHYNLLKEWETELDD